MAPGYAVVTEFHLGSLIVYRKEIHDSTFLFFSSVAINPYLMSQLHKAFFFFTGLEKKKINKS